MSDPTTTPRDAAADAPRFAFVAHLDPLRTVQGSRTRYDCPDLATLDRHIVSLHRLAARARYPDTADACRADIDRLLDRRAWLTLPVAA